MGQLDVPSTGPYGVYRMGGRGNTVVIIGDSIAAGSTGGCWWLNLVAQSSGRITTLKNSGIGGNNSTQMLARFTTDVIAYRPEWVVIQAVTPNDQSASITPATTRANIAAMVEMALLAGIRPIVCLGPPSDTTANRDAILQVNAWLSPWARARGIPVFDLNSPVVDPTDGTYATAMTLDGTHFSIAGAAAVGLWNVPLIPSGMQYAPVLTTGKNDPTNLILNGAFAVDTNADGVADSWNIGSGFATKSLSAMTASEGAGNWQNLTHASGTSYIFANNVITLPSVGDVIEFSARIQSDGGANLKIRPWLNSTNPLPDIFASTTGLPMPASCVIVGQFTVPTALTVMTFRLICDSGAGVIKLGQVTVRNLTALGVT